MEGGAVAEMDEEGEGLQSIADQLALGWQV